MYTVEHYKYPVCNKKYWSSLEQCDVYVVKRNGGVVRLYANTHMGDNRLHGWNIKDDIGDWIKGFITKPEEYRFIKQLDDIEVFEIFGIDNL